MHCGDLSCYMLLMDIKLKFMKLKFLLDKTWFGKKFWSYSILMGLISCKLFHFISSKIIFWNRWSSFVQISSPQYKGFHIYYINLLNVFDDEIKCLSNFLVLSNNVYVIEPKYAQSILVLQMSNSLLRKSLTASCDNRIQFE